MYMKQKQVIFRITKQAPMRYMVEQRHQFLWVIKIFTKGSFDLGLPPYFSKYNVAVNAITSKAKKKGIIPVIIRGQKK
jgi:hypothetical protein